MDTADYQRLVEVFDQEKAMAIAKAIERNTLTPPAFEAALLRLENLVERLEIRLDTKIDSSAATLRSEIVSSRGEILKWMAGAAIGWVVAVAGIAFAIVRLAP